MTEAGQLASELTNDDPATGLRAVAALRTLLESIERLHVERARARGWSWQEIARALGVTKQAVHQKHRRGR